MTTATEALELARRSISDIERYVEVTFVRPTLQDLLDALARGESEAAEALAKLRELRRLGLDRPSDYVDYQHLRADLLRAQSQVYGVVITVIRAATVAAPDVRRAAAAQIPKPRALPDLRFDAAASARARAGQPRGGLDGLGTDPITITTGAGIALAIGIVIAALALGYLLSQTLISVSQEVAGVLIAQARAVQFALLCRSRLEAYRTCIDAGGTAEACAAAAAQVVSTPRDSGTETPTPGSTDIMPWVLLGSAGTVIVFAVGWGLWTWWKLQSSVARALGAVGGPVPLRRIAALPARVDDLDGRKSTYNLEIASGFKGLKKARRRAR